MIRAVGGRMGRVAAILVLALGLAGSVAPPHDSSASGAMARLCDPTGCSAGDQNAEPCTASVWITGVIVPGQRWGDVEIRDDQGVLHWLIWGSHNTAVVDWNRRYRLGGQWIINGFGAEGGGATFWACAGADAVIPR